MLHLYFLFIAHSFLLLIIDGCVIFDNIQDGNCSLYALPTFFSQTGLSCSIRDPSGTINDENCTRKQFSQVSLSLINLDQLNILLEHNAKTLEKFLKVLSSWSKSSNIFKIKLDYSLNTVAFNMTIDKIWLQPFLPNEKLYFHRLIFDITLNQWKQMNLFINSNVAFVASIYYLIFHLSDPVGNECEVTISQHDSVPENLFHRSSMSQSSKIYQ